jgi:3-oxoacyl-[acyl-carrier protein] reductase
VSAVIATGHISFYGATEAMLNSITELLAVGHGPNVRVNGVAPAVVKTKFASALYEGREDQARQVDPLKRLGKPDDVGTVVAFLLCEDADWLTGRTVILDGGVSLTAVDE